MRKFYFLNIKKEWEGPYTLLQIQFRALRGFIAPYTYLWHNKLSKDNCQHPLMCIYGRKKASDFDFMPFWLFSSNIKILINNFIIGLKLKIKKNGTSEKFVKKPIENLKEFEGANKVYLIPSIVSIHDFASFGKSSIKLAYFVEDGETNLKSIEYPIKISFDKNPGIKFEIIMKNPPSVSGVLYKESYGLQNSLLIVNDGESIEISKSSVFDFSTLFPYKPQILNGRFSQANLKVTSKYKNGYNRLILEIKDIEIISPQDILTVTGLQLYDHDKFNIHSSLFGISFKSGGNFTEVTIGDKGYHIYSIAKSIYIIDGINREDLKVFKQKAEIIRIALGLVSGKFYGGICNYVTSDSPDFQNIEGIWYEIERSAITSSRRVIDLNFYREVNTRQSEEYNLSYKSFNSLLDTTLFSTLCNNIYTKENLLHAAELLLSGMGNTDPVQQGALYSVALETLTNELCKVKSDDLAPIRDKILALNVKKDMLIVLNGYTNNITEEGINILKKKIEGMNNPANQDRLIKTFELYSITLTNEDKTAIKNRNNYLHGRSPLNRDLKFELMQISLRLHTLIVALLLKSVGYSGHIINLDTKAYLDNEEKMIQASYEHQISVAKLTEQIENAIAEKDEISINAAKEKIALYLKGSKFRNLIRII